MVRFLVQRPVAVIMAFLAVFILGLVAAGRLPVALMPDIDIPEITVYIELQNYSGKELESAVVTPVRRQLLQVSGLEDMESRTKNGSATIRLRFRYRTSIDLAFIEVNEKIDMAMAVLPKNMGRPRVIKANVTDIPVFYLNIFREDASEDSDFLELSKFTLDILRKRIEQIPEVALVDLTGLSYPELLVIPDEKKLKSLGISYEQIREAMALSNLRLGNIMYRDGHYLFSLQIGASLKTADDVRNIILRSGTRVFRLEELAHVQMRARQQRGLFFSGGHQAVSMAIIQQADARLADLKKEIDLLISQMKADYPALEMEIVRDQSAFLEYSLRNLRSSLAVGALLAFLVIFLFLRDRRSPWLVGISIPVSLVISFLFFYLARMSVNLISLSGLLLGVGMIIDNSIIVIDNIQQHLRRGINTLDACVAGTNEVIRPLISSVLTTCAVFIPLVFLSGLAGALFLDQALAVSIGLLVSFFVSVCLVPVIYYRFIRHVKSKVTRSGMDFHERIYERELDRVMKHPKKVLLISLMLIAAGYILFRVLPVDIMPGISRDDMMVTIDWNENISLEENRLRTEGLVSALNLQTASVNTWIGEKQYLLDNDKERDISGSELYIRIQNPAEIKEVRSGIIHHIYRQYPFAHMEFENPATVFDRLFFTREPVIILKVSDRSSSDQPDLEEMIAFYDSLRHVRPDVFIEAIPLQRYLQISAEDEKLLLYGIGKQSVIDRLLLLFHEMQVESIRSGTELIPVVLRENKTELMEILNTAFVNNQEGNEYPLSFFVKKIPVEDFRYRFAGKEGGFVPLTPVLVNQQTQGFIRDVNRVLEAFPDLQVEFDGRYFGARNLIFEMIIVLIVALLLLYFILAAQFESLSQPLIVMMEIPMDIAGCLLMLWLFGSGINIMSMIGIVVMSGIIINDSILKVDTINHLRMEGLNLETAVREGGIRRLNPILMTTITTVLALTPLLSGRAMGSELQSPLALTVIGGLILGTLVSLCFIPVAYTWLYRRFKRNSKS